MFGISTPYPQGLRLPFVPEGVAQDLTRARACRQTNPEQADHLYQQVERALLERAEQQGVKLSDELSASASLTEPVEHAGLRRCIAEVYVEHGTVLERLNQAESAQACYQHAHAWDHLDMAVQLNPQPLASGPRFSLGQRPLLPAYYVPGAQSDSLLKRLKNNANAVIEIVGPSGAGKRAISKAVVW